TSPSSGPPSSMRACHDTDGWTECPVTRVSRTELPMRIAVLADFGSTFTKVSLVELGTGRLVSHARAPTSADSDVMNGYRAAVADALSTAGPSVTIEARLAASSAGGGLRAASVGL